MPNHIKQKEIIIFLFFYPQPLVLLPCLLAATTDAPQLLVGAGVCGQMSHQSLTSPTDFMEPGRLQLPSKAAPALADPQAEVFPFSYNYAVNDDYSGSAFTASESDNKLGARSVTYSTDDVNGYVAEVSYEGAPTYPQTTAVVAQPAVSVARSPLGESTAQATSYLV